MTSEIKIALLPDRGVVAVDGPDALTLLQGLLTNDISRLNTVPAVFAGLLSPQGKILFDFFVVRTPEGALLDVERDRAGDLVKRLSLYKLRAAVTIKDVSADHDVMAIFGGSQTMRVDLVYDDPRLAALGARAIVAKTEHAVVTTTAADYHDFRIGVGVPEGGRDYAYGDVFPHEALFDQLDGVSFTKGCYVGQEIVSRMEHRGTARRRIVPVLGTAGKLVEGQPVLGGDVEIGRIGSVAGERALAMIRLDRAQEFAEKGVLLRAGDSTLVLDIPAWAHFNTAATPS
jgi:folate-binding protein YgfZ